MRNSDAELSKIPRKIYEMLTDPLRQSVEEESGKSFSQSKFGVGLDLCKGEDGWLKSFIALYYKALGTKIAKHYW